MLQALALLAVIMLVAWLMGQWLPQPRGRMVPWISVAAGLISGRLLGGGDVLTVRNVAWAGGVFLLSQATISGLIAARLISV